MLESLFNKVFRSKETPPQVFSYEFCEVYENTYFMEHLRATTFSRWNLLFKKLHIAGVHKKIFEWLVADEFLSNSKKYMRSPCIFISFFQFAL